MAFVKDLVLKKLNQFLYTCLGVDISFRVLDGFRRCGVKELKVVEVSDFEDLSRSRDGRQRQCPGSDSQGFEHLACPSASALCRETLPTKLVLEHLACSSASALAESCVSKFYPCASCVSVRERFSRGAGPA